ncbi:hypothetical protein [Neisseria iguanae]|uniref:Uncharacterized protein n=1 Tax=Neisseria iguanae TaxID=90242 RepID=A0A2P7TXE4_9NEIS|nr:hypothetical protein [Neisseria iguanae]PSJ79397.1 hypothetical protein C7N83_12465 [Neisseria iguanae]
MAQNSGIDRLLWLLLGAAELAAAYSYTAGRKPYGYIGLGDAAVFVFFGWPGWYWATNICTQAV